MDRGRGHRKGSRELQAGSTAWSAHCRARRHVRVGSCVTSKTIAAVHIQCLLWVKTCTRLQPSHVRFRRMRTSRERSPLVKRRGAGLGSPRDRQHPKKEPRLLFELCSGLLATAGARETVAYKENSRAGEPFLQSLNLPAEPLLLVPKLRTDRLPGRQLGFGTNCPSDCGMEAEQTAPRPPQRPPFGRAVDQALVG